MTDWTEYEERRPLRGGVKKGYDEAHEAMGVGYLILKARAAAGLTQTQLAKKIGSSQPMVARWESGAQVPSVRTLVKVAQATGYELAVGLREPTKRPDRFLALEVIERKGQKTRGRILREAATG